MPVFVDLCKHADTCAKLCVCVCAGAIIAVVTSPANGNANESACVANGNEKIEEDESAISNWNS